MAARNIGLGAAAAAAAWFLLAPVPWPARLWGVVVSIVLPVVAGAQVRLIGRPEAVPRIPVYASSMVSLWVLALVTVPVSGLSRFSAADLGLVVPAVWRVIGTAAGVTAVSIGVLFVMSAGGMRESPLARRLIPVSRREKLVFAGLSMTAGICEEFVFRGFLLHTFSMAWGGPIAVAVSSVVFGALHAYQHLGGAVRAALLGALLCVPTLLTGSILPSVIAHAGIDLISGLLLARRFAPEMA
jgi:CAAX protease family protein